MKLRVYEQVFGFDVSVNYIAPVAEGDALDHLVDVVAESLGIDSDCILLKDLKQILFDIFEDKVETTLPTSDKRV